MSGYKIILEPKARRKRQRSRRRPTLEQLKTVEHLARLAFRAGLHVSANESAWREFAADKALGGFSEWIAALKSKGEKK